MHKVLIFFNRWIKHFLCTQTVSTHALNPCSSNVWSSVSNSYHIFFSSSLANLQHASGDTRPQRLAQDAYSSFPWITTCSWLWSVSCELLCLCIWPWWDTMLNVYLLFHIRLDKPRISCSLQIWGSRNGEYEDCVLLQCKMYFHWQLPIYETTWYHNPEECSLHPETLSVQNIDSALLSTFLNMTQQYRWLEAEIWQFNQLYVTEEQFLSLTLLT
jgi:hypothetical protein